MTSRDRAEHLVRRWCELYGVVMPGSMFDALIDAIAREIERQPRPSEVFG